MKLNAYTIFDSASGLYNRPFFNGSDGEAKRAFADISMDATHPIGQHPEDYSLHRIGIFDDNNAKLTPEKNECLITSLEAISETRNTQNGQMPLELPDNYNEPEYQASLHKIGTKKS